MATSRETIPVPSVVLPIGDGRVEITVIDNEIWLSDYAGGSTHNFTLVIPRMKLQGNKSACQGVFAHHSNKGGDNQSDFSRRVLAARKYLSAEPPRMAGYWYQDPNSAAHGGPVVIIEE